jgi:hypothetical protein
MREGLYKVEFSTPQMTAHGVVYAKGGELRGGDGSYFYVGKYTDVNGRLEATVNFKMHTRTYQPSVFGREKGTINVKGRIGDGTIIAEGTSPESPGMGFQANLIHISD